MFVSMMMFFISRMYLVLFEISLLFCKLRWLTFRFLLLLSSLHKCAALLSVLPGTESLWESFPGTWRRRGEGLPPSAYSYQQEKGVFLSMRETPVGWALSSLRGAWYPCGELKVVLRTFQHIHDLL